MKTASCGLLILIIFLSPVLSNSALAQPTAAIYYVSSSAGNDSNSGLTPGAPLATIAKVNKLALQPGDQVLLKCGDTWRTDPMILNRSGTSAAPITIGSYPAGCANKPVLSGSQPVSGWVLDSGSIYHADLPQAMFPNGINQLFRAGQRLTMGRWPNLTDPNGGYAFIDSHTAGSAQITDADLPAGDWNGAILHIKNIRWSMLDRQVTAVTQHTLTLNTGLSCLVESWGTCTGWGYFINNAKAALDQDGEWYYDAASRRVYLVSTAGLPAQIEASAVLATGTADASAGGIVLSAGSPTAFVIIDNLAVQNWFNDGIGTPAGGMSSDIYHDITVRNVSIKDPNASGINLSTWLQNPTNGRPGLLGGFNLLFQNNLIDGANAFGITGYFASSTFENNTIQNIALVKNLNASGMGCGLTTGECTENGDGFRIRLYNVLDSGFGNTLRHNIFEKIGYNGVDVFGPETTLEENFIHQSCYTKADCGGVRVFGSDSLSTTTVYNVHLIDNVIADIPGNVDGCEASRAPFGMGLYIDYYSRNVEARGNTVVNTTVDGILFQNSSGQAVNNTVYNASSGTEYSAQIDVSGVGSVSLSNNVMVGLAQNAWTLYTGSLSNITASDQNIFFHTYVDKNIAYGPSWTRQNFAQWKAMSHLDANSRTNWFTQPAGEASRAKIFYNPAQTSLTIDLGYRQYLDLNQKPVYGSLNLQPYTSIVLVDNGAAPLTLQSIIPAIIGISSAGFTLRVQGSGFTASSVVRWQGNPRPTTLISSTILTADIAPGDISSLGKYLVTVWDPTQGSGGFETPTLSLTVFNRVSNVYLPQVMH